MAIDKEWRDFSNKRWARAPASGLRLGASRFCHKKVRIYIEPTTVASGTFQWWLAGVSWCFSLLDCESLLQGLGPVYAFCHAAATHFSGIFPWWSQLQRRSTQSGMWLDREMRREVSTGVLTDSTWCRCFCAVTTIAKPSAAGLMFTRGSCPVGFCNQAQPKK